MATTNEIPDKLIDYAAYSSSDELIGLADVEMPTIEFMTETAKGPGIGGEIEMPSPGMFSSMECTINWRTLEAQAVSMLDATTGLNLEFRGATQHWDSANNKSVIVPCIVAIAGIIKSTEMGSFETSANTEAKNVVEVTRLKVTINGSEKLEIDKLSRTYKVGGTDKYASIKSALGKS